MSRRSAQILFGLSLAALILGAALFGGRDCKVPVTGPLASSLAGEHFVPARSWRSGGCRQVK